MGLLGRKKKKKITCAHCILHFIDEDIQTLRGWVTCWGHTAHKVAETGIRSKSLLVVLKQEEFVTPPPSLPTRPGKSDNVWRYFCLAQPGVRGGLRGGCFWWVEAGDATMHRRAPTRNFLAQKCLVYLNIEPPLPYTAALSSGPWLAFCRSQGSSPHIYKVLGYFNLILYV